MEPDSLHHSIRATVAHGVEWIKLSLELIAVLVIVVGAAIALLGIVRRALRDEQPDFLHDRLNLGRALAMALEFQLAADILSTALAPDWTTIGHLAAIATIRTALNFALSHEIREERERERELIRSAPP